MGQLELQDPEAERWSVRGSHVVAPVCISMTVSSSAVILTGYFDSVLTTVLVQFSIQAPIRLFVAFRNACNGLPLFARPSIPV